MRTSLWLARPLSARIRPVAAAKGSRAWAGDSEEMGHGGGNPAAEGRDLHQCDPCPESSFYRDFICEPAGFPTAYIVDHEENMIGAPLIGVVQNQEDSLMNRLELGYARYRH